LLPRAGPFTFVARLKRPPDNVRQLRMPSHFSLSELPVRPGVRFIALNRLEEALGARERLIGGRDGEALHDFRVALRRLRSGLRAYRPWFEDTVTLADRHKLRDIARATGDARDLEVQLHWIEKTDLNGRADQGARRVRKELEHAQKAARRKALRAAHRFPALAERLRPRLTRYTGTVEPDRPLREVSTAAVTAKLTRELATDLDGHLEALRTDDDPRIGHRARIQGKRLRYLVEPFVDEVAAAPAAIEILKRLQDDLGDLHDLDILSAQVGGAACDPDRNPEAAASLAALLEQLCTARRHVLERIRAQRLESDVPDLEREVGRFAAELDAVGSGSDWEIERKYLLNGLPRRRKGRSVVRIDQGWLPGERIVERLRRVRADDGTTTWLRTIKLGRGLVRREVEEEIDEALFRRLWPLTRGKRISKRRYSFRDGSRVWTIDRFLDRDLILAEVELESVDDEVAPPAWLKRYIEREVTGLAGYQNVHLAELVGVLRDAKSPAGSRS
jgi:CHAD domain-containing protein/CYTH domain-containing protein